MKNWCFWTVVLEKTLESPMDCKEIQPIHSKGDQSWAWEWKVKVKALSHVWLCATPWTAAHQAPPSMGFSRQEYWSGVPLPSPLAWYLPRSKSIFQVTAAAHCLYGALCLWLSFLPQEMLYGPASSYILYPPPLWSCNMASCWVSVDLLQLWLQNSSGQFVFQKANRRR